MTPTDAANDQGDAFSPTKLQEIISYVVARVGTTGRVKLTKLLYLIDVEHYARHGTTLTGATWVRWERGPMIRGLQTIDVQLDGHEIAIERYVDGSANPRVDYRPGAAHRFEPRLRDHEQSIVDRVLEAYGGASMTRVMAVAYATPPMRLVESWEAGNEPMLGMAIPFARALGEPRTGLRRFRAIADAVRRPNRGSPEERADLELAVMQEMSGLREAVNGEQLGPAE